MTAKGNFRASAWYLFRDLEFSDVTDSVVKDFYEDER